MRAFLPFKLAFLAAASIVHVVSTVTDVQLSPPVVLDRRSFDLEERGWRFARRAPRELVIPLKFGLMHSNLHTLDDSLMDVSHPDSPNYGKHWTVHDIVSHFAPSPDSVHAVLEWLSLSDIDPSRARLSRSKSWIELNATVDEVEELLKATYNVWEDEAGLDRVGCDHYHIPHHLTEHVELIIPTTEFKARLPPSSPSQSELKKRKNMNLGDPNNENGPKTNGQFVEGTPELGLADCNKFITPICLQTLYNFNDKPNNTDKNTFAIVEFTPQAYLQSDLDMFFRNFSPSQVGKSPILVSIDGGVVQTQNKSFNLNGESDLDLQYAMTLTNPQPVLLLQTGDLIEGAGFDNWLDAVDGPFCTFEGGDVPGQDGIYPDPFPGGYKGHDCGILKPPYVVSVSYGQDEVSISATAAMRQCNEYGKLGLLGSTILYSSGDNGVAGSGGKCLSDGTATPTGKRFNPGFPASCPYITSVGATQIKPTSTVNDPEEACETVIFSGGGFSNIFPMPNYQMDAVQEYLTLHRPTYPPNIYNSSGMSRGFPDLSANGANYVVAVDGQFISVFGTSASAPVVGSILTLINDARISAHKSPIGFINPVIYSILFRLAGFNDIVSGGNQGCGTPGFTATTGWDPVTGLGTPDYEILRGLWLLLP